jgi:putative chitinase
MAFINTLYNLWPDGDQKIPGLRDGIAKAAPEVFAKYGVTGTLVVAHIMAQVSHECGAGLSVEESLYYTTPQRLCKVWPTRFRSIESAIPYLRNARLLGNKVYNGRMGNRSGTDDGYNFRGRGGSQTTGREGYERVQKQTGLPVVDNPGILTDPKYFLLCAVSDFVNCGCMPYARADNVGAVSAALNVGDPSKVSAVVGLEDRKTWLRRWKAALGRGPLDLTLPDGLA